MYIQTCPITNVVVRIRQRYFVYGVIEYFVVVIIWTVIRWHAVCISCLSTGICLKRIEDIDRFYWRLYFKCHGFFKRNVPEDKAQSTSEYKTLRKTSNMVLLLLSTDRQMLMLERHRTSGIMVLISIQSTLDESIFLNRLYVSPLSLSASSVLHQLPIVEYDFREHEKRFWHVRDNADFMSKFVLKGYD